MHRIIAILLLLSLSFQCIVKLGVVTWYQVNKDYIAQNLCENKDKPEMKCCGKCYLKKQLNKTGESDSKGKQLPNKINKTEVAAFLVAAVVTFHQYTIREISVRNPSMQHLHNYDHSRSVFHPPAIC